MSCPETSLPIELSFSAVSSVLEQALKEKNSKKFYKLAKPLRQLGYPFWKQMDCIWRPNVRKNFYYRIQRDALGWYLINHPDPQNFPNHDYLDALYNGQLGLARIIKKEASDKLTVSIGDVLKATGDSLSIEVLRYVMIRLDASNQSNKRSKFVAYVCMDWLEKGELILATRACNLSNNWINNYSKADNPVHFYIPYEQQLSSAITGGLVHEANEILKRNPFENQIMAKFLTQAANSDQIPMLKLIESYCSSEITVRICFLKLNSQVIDLLFDENRLSALTNLEFLECTRCLPMKLLVKLTANFIHQPSVLANAIQLAHQNKNLDTLVWLQDRFNSLAKRNRHFSNNLVDPMCLPSRHTVF